MKKHLLLKLAVFSLFTVAAVFFFTPSKALAYDPLCGVLAPAVSGACGYGQDYSTCTVVDRASGIYPNCGGYSSAQLKQNFINNVTYFQNVGGFQRVGALWLEQAIQGHSGKSWVNLINQSNVTMGVGYATYGLNTAYDSNTNGIIQYPDTVTALSLIIYENGVEHLAVKLNCGNPVGQLTPLTNNHVTVQGRVFNVQNGSPLPNVPIYVCNSNGSQRAIVYTNSNGFYSVSIPSGQGFCLRVHTSGSQINGSTAYIRPYAVDGITGTGSPDAYSPSCGAFTGAQNPDYCTNYNSYECQIAGGTAHTLNACGVYTRSDSTGYDFVINPVSMVMGRVFNAVSNTGYANVPVYVCNSNGSQRAIVHTNSQGFYSVAIPGGQGFCLRVVGNSVNGQQVHIRPWAVDGITGTGSPDAYSPSCGAFTGAQNPNYCTNYQTYECQVVGATPHVLNPCGVYNRQDMTGYDFVVSPPGILGHIDQTSCTTLSGWAAAGFAPGTSLRIDVYENGPAGGGGRGIYSGYTTVYRSDVNTYLTNIWGESVTGNHGFNISIGAFTKSGARSLYVYAISPSANYPNVLLGGGPTYPPSNCICPPFYYPNVSAVPVNLYPQNIPYSYVPWYGPAGSVYNSYSPDGTYAIQYVYDSPGGLYSSQFKPHGRSYGPFTVNYTPYINNYPYDSQSINVNYLVYYNQYQYVADGPAVYNNYWTCNAWTLEPQTYTWTWYGYTYTYTYYTYVCTGGWTYHHVYLGQAVEYRAYYPNQTVDAQTQGPGLPECFQRHYSLQPNNGSVTFNSYEHPTQINYNGSVTANFYVNHGGSIIRPYQVNGIDTSLQLRIYHINNQGRYSLRYIGGLSPSTTTIGPSTYGPTYGSTYYAYTSHSYSTSLPPLSYGDVACVVLQTSPSAGGMNEYGQITSITSYLAQQPSNGWPPGGNSLCSPPLAAKPYFKVFGGDVMAGNGIGTACTDPYANIYGWDNSPGYSGSGSQLAVFAMNAIRQFASSQNNPGANTSPPTGLTFANTTSLNGYGGGFGTDSTACATNYFAQGYSNSLPYYRGLGDKSGSYQLAPSSTLNINQIPAGRNYTIYVNGPITINNNVTYNGVNSSLSGNLSNIPHLKLIVNGDINVDNNVTSLYGTYVSYGTFNDCANVPSYNWFYDSTHLSAPLNQTCGQQLVVNGSVVAQNVDLHRTYQTLHDASTNETPTNSNGAEVFNYSPLTWLAYPQKTSPQVESITSLPPVL